MRPGTILVNCAHSLRTFHVGLMRVLKHISHRDKGVLFSFFLYAIVERSFFGLVNFAPGVVMGRVWDFRFAGDYPGNFAHISGFRFLCPLFNFWPYRLFRGILSCSLRSQMLPFPYAVPSSSFFVFVCVNYFFLTRGHA